MGKQPVAKGPALFVEVLCPCNQIQLGDFDPLAANHVTELTAEAEVDRFIDRWIAGRWLIQFSEPLSSRPGLLWPGEQGCDSRYRADRRAGSAANADIPVIRMPGLFWLPRSLC